MSRPVCAVLVCAASPNAPLRQVGGLSLIERLLRQLGRVDGVVEITLVAPWVAPEVRPSSWVRARVRRLVVEGGDPWAMFREAQVRLPDYEYFVLVSSDLVVDQRLLMWLADQTSSVLVNDAGGSIQMLGFMAPVNLGSGVAPLRFVSPGDFPTYSPEQRGDVPVHLLRVGSEADTERAWQVLLDGIDKRTKDLPATVFDPPFENFLVRRLAPTNITPNQVTAFTTGLGFFVAWLFLQGWLLTGVLLAIAVEVLDGVDGKLARLKFMTSKLGELEHVFDFFYENSWWLALGAGFAAQGVSWAWPAALVLCASDLADNLAYLFYSRKSQFALRRAQGERKKIAEINLDPARPELVEGRRDGSLNLDEATPLLSRFRLIAGRRNIYIWMMLPAAAFGGAATAFAIVVAWAVITAAAHWVLAATNLPRE